MNIAELFIDLGVKGGDKTLGALTGMQKGLKDTASMSLEAKAALVGAFYAMERLFAGSNKRGTELANFNATTGVSVQTLQRYQYAAQQVGVANEEVENSFRGLQQAMVKIEKGEMAPQGMDWVTRALGRPISQRDVDEFKKNPEQLVKFLQAYALKEKDAALRTNVLGTFGLGNGMIAALSQNAFKPEVLAKAPTYGEGEVKALQASGAAWANLGTKIEMAVGHFNAKHGGEIVDNLTKLVDPVMKLATAFERLATKAGAFEGITKVFKGWILIFDGIVKAIQVIDDFTGKDKKKSDAVKDDLETGAYDAKNFAVEALASIEDTISELPNLFGNLTEEALREHKEPTPAKHPSEATPKAATATKPGVAAPKGAQAATKAGASAVSPPSLRLVVPPAPSAAAIGTVAKPIVTKSENSSATVTNTVTQNLNFSHDGKDAQKTGKDVKKATQDALSQSPALSHVK